MASILDCDRQLARRVVKLTLRDLKSSTYGLKTPARQEQLSKRWGKPVEYVQEKLREQRDGCIQFLTDPDVFQQHFHNLLGLRAWKMKIELERHGVDGLWEKMKELRQTINKKEQVEDF